MIPNTPRLLVVRTLRPLTRFSAARVPSTQLPTTMPKRTVIKSAKSGRFVSKRQEKRSPSTTYRQTVKSGRKKK